MSPRPSSFFLVLLLSLWSLASFAVETRIRGELALEPPGAAAKMVILRLTPQAEAAAAVPQPVTMPLEVPGESRMDLAPGVIWRLEAESPDLWSEPRWLYLKPGEEAAPVTLRFFPVATVSGALELPPEAGPPSELEVRFEPSPGQASKILPPRSSVSCPVRARRFQCSLPESVLDVRLRAPGFVPVYKWDVALSAGLVRDLGSVPLAPGSSVSGWVRMDGDKPASRECRVQLAPQTYGMPGTSAGRQGLQAMTLETQVNERGFFQIVGAEPGTYVLTASQPGLAKASLAPVEVRKGLETMVTAPLLLTRPGMLAVNLRPALDPYGKPWTVHLQRYEKDRGAAEFERGPASENGRWERTGLASGSYLLLILGDGDSRWLTREIEVHSGDASVDVEIPVVPVRGKVTLGDEPLEASLWFGGLHGPRKVRFDSDERGEFEGMLPATGLWEVELVADDLRLRLPPVEVVLPPESSQATVTIRVPDTRIRGEVVDEEGKPLEGAAVRIMPAGRKSSTVTTESDGSFEVRGIEAGAATVQASLGARTSGWVSTEVIEGEESPRLRLVARSARTLQGRVFSAQGPVVGARIEIWPDLTQAGASTIVQEISGPAGEFTVTLPAQAESLNVVVEAPGHATRMFKTAAPSGQPLEIPLEPVGGTLVIDLGEATVELVSRAGAGILAHGGTFVPFQKLPQWARIGRVEAGSAHQLVIPNLDPGEYMLCAGLDPRKAKVPQNGGSAQSCAQGQLGPLQELVLALPSLSGDPG